LDENNKLFSTSWIIAQNSRSTEGVELTQKCLSKTSSIVYFFENVINGIEFYCGASPKVFCGSFSYVPVHLCECFVLIITHIHIWEMP